MKNVPPLFVRLNWRRIVVALALLAGTRTASAQKPVQYRLSFADAIHHVARVEAIFADVPAGALRLEMSRSSPGRYAAFEFAKNVFGERITDAAGKKLTAMRPNAREWDVIGHHGTIRVAYEVFGDRVDGTFLAIDSTHAHINFPAILVWAPRLANRRVRMTFVLPGESSWKVATQLYPTKDPLTFTAPNLQYLMDSPTELSNFSLWAFSVPSLNSTGRTQTIRISMHHVSTNLDLQKYVSEVGKIVRQEQAIFGELPNFEPGSYTFLVDYLPWDNFDGMEHRNSAVITGHFPPSKSQLSMVRNAAHEFFHCWNVRRIRPASLEPFNFADVDTSGELWLAEGFTNYYTRLVMMRSGLEDAATGVSHWAGEIYYVISSPGGRFRSVIDMSRLAPLLDDDGAKTPDPTYWDNTFVSYYSMGDVIALGLDLTLRARSDSHVTLDDFMRKMWRVYGKPRARAPGLVSKPYTLDDVRSCLAEVSGDKAFADDFVRRYIEGKQRIDYAPLLLRAGFVLRKKSRRWGAFRWRRKTVPMGGRLCASFCLVYWAHLATMLVSIWTINSYPSPPYPSEHKTT